METYSISFEDPRGKVVVTKDFEAMSDRDAVSISKQMSVDVPASGYELWRAGGRVAGALVYANWEIARVVPFGSRRSYP